jgi:hypothetical protein
MSPKFRLAGFGDPNGTVSLAYAKRSIGLRLGPASFEVVRSARLSNITTSMIWPVWVMRTGIFSVCVWLSSGQGVVEAKPCKVARICSLLTGSFNTA